MKKPYINGLKKYDIVHRPRNKKWIDWRGKEYRGKVAVFEIDDGSMACVYFRGYVPADLPFETLCQEDWERGRLQLVDRK